ncbi:MAG: dihydrolipoyl dehydrogenase [Candidatus Omnitrophica bacterium]|nr:dihydrolipoyl dehydrogenase [Candidatus Omnitrophota bacterium]
MREFDVIVIGSGGGSKITSPAAKLGLKVAVIEKGPLGGTCLNRGCIPSKMLIHPADVAIAVREARKFDIHNDPKFTVDFAKLVNRISATVDGDSASISAGYTRNPNITFYAGEGKFISNKVIKVGNEEITADKIFITVGARPQIPSISGLEGTPFMTSTEALRNTTLPKKLIVLGGGYIGTELGFAYAAFGTEVHFIVRSTLLRHEDQQIASEFQKVFSKYHDVHLHSTINRVAYSNGQFTVFYTQDGAQKELSAESLLVATGVTCNTDTLNLQNTDIEVDDNGFVKVNDCLQTTVDGVYAFGDCIGRYLFRHSANFEGEYLFENIFVKPSKQAIKYPPVPHAVFSHPQIAGVGLTQEQAKAAGIDCVVGVNNYSSSGMGMALLAESGFVKIIVERSSRKLIGAHIVGDEASNMIHLLIAFMNMNATLDDLLRMIYIHPALPEIVRNAARKAKAAIDT